MRSLFFLLFLSLAAASCSNAEQNKSGETPVAAPVASRHSTAFNQSVEQALESYYKLSEAFVNWDSASAPNLVKDFGVKLDSLSIQDIAKDSLAAAGTHLEGSRYAFAKMAKGKNLAQMRSAFNTVSDHFFGFLKAARYDRQKLYLHQCPMAFNDEETGVWVSKEEGIRNPYLGLHHPRYGKGMLKCGENKDVINHTGTK